MTGPVEFVERWHRDMEWIAREYFGGREWTAREGQILGPDGKLMAEVALGGGPQLTAAVLIATNASPSAVLRRIASDRKTLEAHPENPHDPGYCLACTVADPGFAVRAPSEYPCATVRLIAEGWGWTGPPPKPDWPECMCTPTGECGRCWEKRQGAPNANVIEGGS